MSRYRNMRCQQVLGLLADADGEPLSLAQIAARLGLSNRSSVQPYLDELREAGAVRRVEGWTLAAAERSVPSPEQAGQGDPTATPPQGGVVAGATTWRVQAIPGRPDLNITLVLDTAAPLVVAAVEAAAASAGVELEREAG